MAKISEVNLPLVKKLYYEDKKSMNFIAAHLSVSLDAVVYFMRKYNLKRRSASENEKIKFENKPLSYKLTPFPSKSDRELQNIGATLYWAEGYKTSKSTGIDFANSDPHMINIFVKFLHKICGVNQPRLRVQLYCHKDQDVSKNIDFWSKLTKIPKSQFTKPYINRKSDTSNTRRMNYGMVHIRYSDKKLLSQMMKWIRELKDTHCVGTQVVNEGGL